MDKSNASAPTIKKYSLLFVDDAYEKITITKTRINRLTGNYDLEVIYTPPAQADNVLEQKKIDFIFNLSNEGVKNTETGISKEVAVLTQVLIQELQLLEYSKEELNAILESASEGIEASDIHGNIKFVNPAFLKITGIPLEERIGKNAFEVNKDGILAKTLQTQKPVSSTLTRAPGSKSEVFVTGAPVIRDNVMEGAVIVIKDVSETLRLAREVERERELLTSLYDRFGQFVYVFEDIVANSKRMKELIEVAQKATKSSSTVLIIGESGAGKELFAQAIHSSSRANLPFIAVNCASIPENLLETELFGYEKGAFTGASTRKIGLFELAKNGTVFLDEIGDLNLFLQAKLLRVLQEREFRRVGGNEVIPFQARIIAATNRDIPKMIEEGTFREDLYYRINVIPILMPPLRERIEDFSELAEKLLNKVSRKVGKKIYSVAPDVIEAMACYKWPGNVREMENVLERAVNMCEGSCIMLEDIDPFILNYSRERETVDFSLKAIERKQISEALRFFGSDLKGKKLAANALGISLAGLYKKMKRYGFGFAQNRPE